MREVKVVQEKGNLIPTEVMAKSIMKTKVVRKKFTTEEIAEQDLCIEIHDLIEHGRLGFAIEKLRNYSPIPKKPRKKP